MAIKKAVKRILSKKPAPVVEVIPPVSTGPLCECGKPVAEGQTYVCKDHIRSS